MFNPTTPTPQSDWETQLDHLVEVYRIRGDDLNWRHITEFVSSLLTKALEEEGESLGYRRCKICNQIKPHGCYYYNSHNNPHIDFRCKDCHTSKSRERLRESYDPDKQRVKSIQRKLSGAAITNFKRMSEKYPERYRARYTLRNAVRTGKIKKGLCEMCGDVQVTAHHEDYSKPFEVRWLCRKHHGLVTRKSPTHQK